MTEENARRRENGLKRRERTRQKLLEAAARVVAESGERNATIDDFIQAAGVARGTFYNYYATRQDLLDDLWGWFGRNPFLEIHQACLKLEDPAERIVAEARLVLRGATENSAWGWLVYALSASGQTVNEDLLGYPRPDLVLGLRQGRFTFDELSCASDLVVGTVRIALKAVLSEARPKDYAHGICVLLLRALGVPNAEALEISGRPLPTNLWP
ncbi:TetR/AcrR family transcriptional regulator [Pseudomonas akapageensis]|uniref:TetR/AcrR family transcriptional regulator n=1 Tax=Pseudomonas akapageensis TaxID=2609961 RepID=UPI00140B9E72|nr:TetR/AcrR family transcriptional regulator [Pseudomonas akapageensis]